MKPARILTAVGVAVSASSALAAIQDINLGTPTVVHQFTLGQPESYRPGGLRVDGTTYNDTVNFTGSGYSPGGATSTTSTGGTRMGLDLITTATTGGTIDQIGFSVANFNTITVSARARVRFFYDNGSGSPGPALGGFSFAAFAFAPGVTTLTSNTGLNFNPLPPFPQSFWMGLFFDQNGVTGATVARLNNFGIGLFDPPVIGSSADQDWLSTLTGGSNSLFDNPAGTVRNSPFAGNPVANYGLLVNVINAVPAPSTTALLGLGGLIAARRRRA